MPPSTSPSLETPEGSLPLQRPGLPRAAWWGAGALFLILAVVFLVRSGKDKGNPQAARGIPVATTAVKKGDMRILLGGLGTVTPVQVVTVRSRVDGQLVRVAFTEGQFVKEGDLLAEIDPRPYQVQLMQAEGQLAKDQAALQNANSDLRRLQALVAQGIISRQQLDTQSTAVAQFEASIKADQSQVESAKLNLTYSRITAPLSGRVGLRLVDAGNMVRASDPNGLAVVAPVQPINVVFTLAGDAVPQVLAKVRAGKHLRVEAWDREQKRMLGEGRLAAVDNQVDPATGTVRLKAVFANEDGALFPNQFVNARLEVDTLRGVVLAPASAIQHSPQGDFVYVAKADGTAEMRPVTLLASEGEQTAIGAGLSPGELLITDGLEKLRPGSKVQVEGDSRGKGPEGKGKGKG
ncbi:MAG: MdtA/MuxA family multidrug efflux RND transporter periplasmic adaptor subunit [Acidobacteria bacterium]|nr:MdtA/MuxA family multidrug efflux RND transporter periplasmic adaptor subunit [Acidobacteriota bacterium]